MNELECSFSQLQNQETGVKRQYEACARHGEEYRANKINSEPKLCVVSEPRQLKMMRGIIIRMTLNVALGQAGRIPRGRQGKEAHEAALETQFKGFAEMVFTKSPG